MTPFPHVPSTLMERPPPSQRPSVPWQPVPQWAADEPQNPYWEQQSPKPEYRQLTVPPHVPSVLLVWPSGSVGLSQPPNSRWQPLPQ